MRVWVLAAALVLAGCRVPQYLPCATGAEVRLDGGQQQDPWAGTQTYGSAGVTVYYDLTGDCGAAR